MLLARSHELRKNIEGNRKLSHRVKKIEVKNVCVF